MLDIGFMEILVIGALALIVVGPKDLPGLLRTVGQFVGKARSMARDFQRTMDEAAREADLGDVADAVKGKNKLPFGNQVVDSIKEFEKTVKTEIEETRRAADAPSIKAPSPASATTTPAAPKATEASPSKAETPKPAQKPARAKPAPKKTAGSNGSPRPQAAKAVKAKPAAAKRTTAKAAGKPSAKPKRAKPGPASAEKSV